MLGENVLEVNEMDCLEVGNEGIVNFIVMFIDCKGNSLMFCLVKQCIEFFFLLVECVFDIFQKLNIDDEKIVFFSKRKMFVSDEI